MKIFNKISLFHKIMSLSTLFLILIFSGSYFFALPELYNLIYSERELGIRENVEIAYSIIENEFNKSQQGEITVEEAKNNAIAQIKGLRFAKNSGYFWINDFTPNMIMHPIKPELDGSNLSGNEDPNGKKLFIEMVNVVKKSGEGYVDYQWSKVGSSIPVDKRSFVKGFTPWGWIIGNGVYVDDIEKVISEIEGTILLIFIVIFIIIIGAALIFAKNISSPIKELQLISNKVAEGNVDVFVAENREDELGALAKSFNKMTLNIKTLLNEVEQKGRIAEQAANEAHKLHKESQKQEEYLDRNIKILLEEMEKLAQGDLLVKVEAEKQDDNIAKLFNGFNLTVENIKSLITQVKDSVEATASASAEISASAEQMAAGTQEQASQATEVANSTHEMLLSFQENNKMVEESYNKVKEAGEVAKNGGKIMNITTSDINEIAEVFNIATNSVKELGNNSDKIGEIIQVIDEIADQTNLLALNAAIEAARAGEQGRGFAVVADEVRKLAERTTKATKEIADMINKIQNDTNNTVLNIEKGNEKVERGKHNVQNASQTLGEIINKTNEVVEIVASIESNSKNQTNVVQEISNSISGITTVTGETALGIQQISQASDDLNKLTERLQDLISMFKIDEGSRRNTKFLR